jgi:16S rRNA G966 N2-methylase RsmD
MPHTRPTTDIAKEGLFNVLENNLDLSTLRTLDLFGGTGSISYELASRGVRDLTVVEKDPAMFAFIQKSARELGLSEFYRLCGWMSSNLSNSAARRSILSSPVRRMPWQLSMSCRNWSRGY